MLRTAGIVNSAFDKSPPWHAVPCSNNIKTHVLIKAAEEEGGSSSSSSSVSSYPAGSRRVVPLEYLITLQLHTLPHHQGPL